MTLNMTLNMALNMALNLALNLAPSALVLIFDRMTERPGKRASLDARGIKCHDHDGAGDQAPEGHDNGCQKHGAIARPFHRYPPAVDQRGLFAECGTGRHEILPTGLILREAFFFRESDDCDEDLGSAFLSLCAGMAYSRR